MIFLDGLASLQLLKGKGRGNQVPIAYVRFWLISTGVDDRQSSTAAFFRIGRSRLVTKSQHLLEWTRALRSRQAICSPEADPYCFFT